MWNANVLIVAASCYLLGTVLVCVAISAMAMVSGERFSGKEIAVWSGWVGVGVALAVIALATL